MKNLILLIAVLAIGSSVFANKTKIVNYTKSGGLLTMYSKVSSTYDGEINGRDTYTVDCSGMGFNRCKVDLGISGGNQNEDNLLEMVDLQIEEMHSSIDLEISNDAISGNGSTTVQVTKSDNTVTVILLKWIWSYSSENDETYINLVVEDLGDIL